MTDRETPATSWAAWAWQAYRDGRLIDAARAEKAEAEVERLRDALSDLVSWFPDAPSQPEWRIRAGEHGADDAVAAARAALAEDTP